MSKYLYLDAVVGSVFWNARKFFFSLFLLLRPFDLFPLKSEDPHFHKSSIKIVIATLLLSFSFSLI